MLQPKLYHQKKQYSMIYNIWKLMRPRHYLKNALLFVSITFSGKLFEFDTLLKVIYGFIAFSLLSSAVYTLNDIFDANADRQHEIKKFRPIASGAVSVVNAYILVFCLLLLSTICNNMHNGSLLKSLLFMALYFLVNVGYSLGLKHIPFVDITLLASGFLIRVLYGAVIINSEVSSWVSLTVISISFYLGLGKRRNELKKSNGQAMTRKVLLHYSFNFLDKFMYLCLALSIVFYALWSADIEVIARYGTNKLIWTVPFVIILMMKYSADIESDSHGDPVDVVTNDKVLIIMVIIYAIVMLLLIYIPKI